MPGLAGLAVEAMEATEGAGEAWRLELGLGRDAGTEQGFRGGCGRRLGHRLHWQSHYARLMLYPPFLDCLLQSFVQLL